MANPDFSIREFHAWTLTKPADEIYRYVSPCGCAVAQFLCETGRFSCPTCDGSGLIIEFRRYAGEAVAGEPYEIICPDCDGESEEDDATPMERFQAAVDRALRADDVPAGLTEVHGDPLLKKRRAA